RRDLNRNARQGGEELQHPQGARGAARHPGGADCGRRLAGRVLLPLRGALEGAVAAAQPRSGAARDLSAGRVGPRVTEEKSSRRPHVVVMIDGIDALGGAETLAVELALRLDPERFERTLCITRWAEHYETEQPVRSLLDRLRASGVRILGIERSAR